jgi:hypothetical protein
VRLVIGIATHFLCLLLGSYWLYALSSSAATVRAIAVPVHGMCTCSTSRMRRFNRVNTHSSRQGNSRQSAADYTAPGVGKDPFLLTAGTRSTHYVLFLHRLTRRLAT